MSFNLTRRLFAATAAIALSMTGLVSVIHADTPWGPSRPTITLQGDGSTTPGFTHVQFNSIVNNPHYGDERTFLDGAAPAEIPTGDGTFHDVLQVEPGQEYWMRVFVHNNADPSLNASGQGIATGAKVKIALPSADQVATSWNATASIWANNATNNANGTPDGHNGLVWDTMNFQNSNVPFSLSYVNGSAREFNGLHTNWDGGNGGMQLSDSIVGDGALVGYQNADGNLPGCFQYTATVFIKVKVNGPSLNFTKQVTTIGSSDWQSNLNANAGDHQSWLLTMKNPGNLTVTNVTVKDQLQSNLQLVPGTVKQFDSVHTNGLQLSDTDLFTNGINIGALAGNGGVVYIRFQTIAKDDGQGNTSNNCTIVAKNTAVATASGVAPIYSAATVTVKENCQTTPPPTTPPTTPQTGPESALAGVFGTGALGYATRAYLRSKRAVTDSLKSVAKR